MVDIIPPCRLSDEVPICTGGCMTKFHTMSSSMDTYIFSFYPRVTTIWNILPVAIYVVDTSLSILAQGLTMWLYSCICPSIIISGHATVITTLLNSSVLHV